MQPLNDRAIVVAGGTGNVGSFITGELLKRGTTVAVPSRSEEKLDGLREHLAQQIGDTDLERLHTLVGNVGEEAGAEALREQITSEVGAPDGVVASLGQLVPAPSLLKASTDDLKQVLNGYLLAHFVAARTFLPGLTERGGTYVFIQGPLAFEPWEGSEADLVSIATAGQQMLFRTLAQELDDTPARVVELVSHAFIRERQTQPSSPIPGEAVGAFAASLLSDEADAEIHGKSIPLRSLEPLADAGLDISGMQ